MVLLQKEVHSAEVVAGAVVSAATSAVAKSAVDAVTKNSTDAAPSATDNAANVLSKLVSKVSLDDLKVLRDLVKQESESSAVITERGKGSGLKHLHATTAVSQGLIVPENLPKLWNILARAVARLNPKHMEIVQDALKELELSQKVPHREMQIEFDDGSGHVFVIAVSVSLLDSGKVEYHRGVFQADFTLADDYIVVKHTSSKNSFFGRKYKACKFWHTIQYVKPGLTREHLDTIAKIGFIAPQLAELSHDTWGPNSSL